MTYFAQLQVQLQQYIENNRWKDWEEEDNIVNGNNVNNINNINSGNWELNNNMNEYVHLSQNMDYNQVVGNIEVHYSEDNNDNKDN
eukprot:CAMPEP_0116924712 /NCGR_PEP_ID=MMETSP0467-20121206/23682_1 /TAXON_ID=283647 /ORGANISM="Mesodinium pulex, Strain SPMC105" /LENGTH=85 /DNA_ID=CAMNT_0004603609 /DNA_START=985 /DNA_END=1242 /DNA_ORIENTATION=+